MQNPYETLGVQVKASNQDILSAYRFHALKYHPERNPSQKTLPEFLQLTAAYQILSNAESRAEYDRFALIDQSKTPPPTQQAALELFSHIFGTSDPFACDFDVGMSNFGAFPGMNETKFRPRVERTEKAGDVRVDLELKLEELYFGCLKKREIRRKILNQDGTFYEKTEIIEINVQKGWKSGTEIKFKELGNEEVGIVPSDLIFVVKELKHDEFERHGDDLLVKVKISLLQALCGFTTEIKTLDGRALHVEMNEVVQNNGFKTVHGEGMPKVQGGFGDLRVEFQVDFPKHIPEDVKVQLKTLLEGL